MITNARPGPEPAGGRAAARRLLEPRCALPPSEAHGRRGPLLLSLSTSRTSPDTSPDFPGERLSPAATLLAADRARPHERSPPPRAARPLSPGPPRSRRRPIGVEVAGISSTDRLALLLHLTEQPPCSAADRRRAPWTSRLRPPSPRELAPAVVTAYRPQYVERSATSTDDLYLRPSTGSRRVATAIAARLLPHLAPARPGPLLHRPDPPAPDNPSPRPPRAAHQPSHPPGSPTALPGLLDPPPSRNQSGHRHPPTELTDHQPQRAFAPARDPDLTSQTPPHRSVLGGSVPFF